MLLTIRSLAGASYETADRRSYTRCMGCSWARLRDAIGQVNRQAHDTLGGFGGKNPCGASSGSKPLLDEPLNLRNSNMAVPASEPRTSLLEKPVSPS